ncbi:translation initiation factor 2 [Dactylosporangium sp. NPDC005572]|uniref:translation initiation factor 2 n=1 Tax=Dactylosporangium sp. NPDC005572 TaxID=3156889 RepID=UPI00339F5DB1
MSDEDAYWRRPAEGAEPPPPATPTTPSPVSYSGPPRGTPPPHGWRPPTVENPIPPRKLPGQDRERIDREEQAATILTRGMALFAGAVLLVLLFILCGRALF